MTLVDKLYETTLTRKAWAYVRNVIWEPDKHCTVAESQGYSLIQVRRSGVSRTLSYVRKYKTWLIIGCLRYLPAINMKHFMFGDVTVWQYSSSTRLSGRR